MNTNAKIPSKKWVGNSMAGTFIMGSCAISMSYISYAFTDLAKIPLGATGIINFAGTFLSIFMSFTVGMVMNKTSSRFGQCRPYLLFGYIATVIGCFIMYMAGIGTTSMMRIVIITIGFLLMQSANSVRIASMYGLERIAGGADYEARTFMSSRANLGISGGLVLEGPVILPLAKVMGGGVKGFMGMEVIVGVIGILAYYYLFRVTKGYDLPGTKPEAGEPEKKEKTSIGNMIKSIVMNRAALSVFIAETFRFFGFTTWFALIVYQCKYVIGDMNSMVIVLTMTNIMGMIASYLAVYGVRIMKGRKRLACTVSILVIISFIGVGMFGQTLWGFVIFSCLGYFFMCFYDSVSPMMFADSGEYWLHKTGKDNRTYLTSIAGMPINIGMTLSSFGFTGVLMLINYVLDQAMTAHAATTLTWAVSLVPAVCYFVAFVCLAFFHGISDKDMEKYCVENEAKYGAAPEE